MKKLLLAFAIFPLSAFAQHWDLSVNGGMTMNMQHTDFQVPGSSTTLKGRANIFNFSAVRVTSGKFYYGLSASSTKLNVNATLYYYYGYYWGTGGFGTDKKIEFVYGDPVYKFELLGGKSFIVSSNQFDIGLRVGVMHSNTKSNYIYRSSWNYYPTDPGDKVVFGGKMENPTGGIDIGYTRYFASDRLGIGLKLSPSLVEYGTSKVYMIPLMLGVHYRLGYDHLK